MRRALVVMRRIIGFDLKGMASIVLWALRRRHGVPPGARAVPYAGEYAATVLMFLFAVVVETVAVEALLRGLHVPAAVRVPILIIDGYGVLITVAVAASIATRPHVVSADELRIRWGAFFDLRVPRDLISSVRLARNDNEHRTVSLEGSTLAVATASRTNVVVELTEPVTVVRPLGRRGEARTIRFFADRPDEAVQALRITDRVTAHDAPSARTT